MSIDQAGYRRAAQSLAVSALLHLIAGPLSGWADVGLLLVPVGVLYLLATLGLQRGWRALGFVVFPVMLGGSLICYAASGSQIAAPIPGWIILGIIAADLACAAFLFRILWRSPVTG